MKFFSFFLLLLLASCEGEKEFLSNSSSSTGVRIFDITQGNSCFGRAKDYLKGTSHERCYMGVFEIFGDDTGERFGSVDQECPKIETGGYKFLSKPCPSSKGMPYCVVWHGNNAEVLFNYTSFPIGIEEYKRENIQDFSIRCINRGGSINYVE